MVVGVPPAVASASPPADGAVPTGQRIGLDLDAEPVEEARLDRAVVRRHLANRNRDPFVASQNDVHRVGRPALEALDLLGVGAELQHGRRLGVARQLGVVGLVAPRTERGGVVGTLDPPQEVGVTPPPRLGAPVEERGLVDDAGAGGHGPARGLLAIEQLPCPVGLRSGRGLRSDRTRPVGVTGATGARRRIAIRDRHHRGALAGQPVQVGLLVLEAPLLQQRQHRVGAVGLRDRAGRCQPVVPGHVLARQVRDQVGRADHRHSVDPVHPTPPLVPSHPQ